MHFDSALNLAWALLGLLALAITFRAALRRSSSENRPAAWLHIVGVALIIAALFPYISATDDVLRIEHFNAQHDKQHPGHKSHNDQLIRLYETMDAPVAAAPVQLTFNLLFIAFVVIPVRRLIDRSEPFESGRSPPLFTHPTA